MLTPFGKELRNIRIDNDIILYDMAKALEVSSTYLSSMENCRELISAYHVRLISDIYSVDYGNLFDLAYESNKMYWKEGKF